MQYKTGKYMEALLTVQKKISIFKALNGNDSADSVLVTYIVELGLIHYALRRFDEAIETWREAEKVTKRIPA
jgi:tetratricopeptide (TPR) repeat protein